MERPASPWPCASGHGRARRLAACAALLLLPAAGPCSLAPRPAPRHCYVHIPFCVQRCFYCDFPVRVLGKSAAVSESEKYLELLLAEIRSTCRRGEPEGLWGAAGAGLETLYFGGGTPSLMAPAHLAEVVETLEREGFPLVPGAEVTLEMDPGTFDRGKLEAFLAAGVSRVNLGVQSFDSSVLEAAGRFHRAPQVHEALAACAGVGSVGLDLISGLPLLTGELWRETLRQAGELKKAGLVDHVSVYDLTLEPDSPFGKRGLEQGEAPLPAEDEAAAMLGEASRALQEAGLEHYEVSNFAVPGRRSRHNMAYWRLRDFLGFGMGATSFLGGQRYARPRKYGDYKLWTGLLQQASLGKTLLSQAEGFTPLEARLEELEERLMLALRTSDGLDLQELGESYGAKARAVLEASLAKHAELTERRGESLRLSAPEGFMLSNDVISTAFADLEEAREELLASGLGA